MENNLYQILEIPEDADRATIKKAYFAKIKEFSPSASFAIRKAGTKESIREGNKHQGTSEDRGTKAV